jgi:hypothetical protein
MTTPDEKQQDTPGRPDPSGSRQQAHPGQVTQTGNPDIDKRGADPDNPTPPRPKVVPPDQK